VKRLGVFDPSGRLIEDLAEAADRAKCELERIDSDTKTAGLTAVLVAPEVYKSGAGLGAVIQF